MTERYANLAHSTLSSTINASVQSLTVANTSNFPNDGNFRIVVDNEIMIVTGVSGTTFTVSRAAEGTSAASHNAGTIVAHVLTVGALQLAVEQWTTGGASGYSGYSGLGSSGYSGYSGMGASGYSGYSGSGASGYSGYSGLAPSGYYDKYVVPNNGQTPSNTAGTYVYGGISNGLPYFTNGIYYLFYSIDWQAWYLCNTLDVYTATIIFGSSDAWYTSFPTGSYDNGGGGSGGFTIAATNNSLLNVYGTSTLAGNLNVYEQVIVGDPYFDGGAYGIMLDSTRVGGSAGCAFIGETWFQSSLTDTVDPCGGTLSIFKLGSNLQSGSPFYTMAVAVSDAHNHYTSGPVTAAYFNDIANKANSFAIRTTGKAYFDGNVQTTGDMKAATYHVGATAGIDATVALAKLTTGGSNGSLTVSKGIITAYTAPT